MGVMDIGNSALRAAYTRLQTTGHNIANASTPGYSRQEATVASAGSQMMSGRLIGGGVEVVTVERRYDAHLTREMHTAAAASAADDTRAAGMARLERLFSDPDAGVGASHARFELALGDLVNQPADSATRTVAFERAAALARNVAGTDGAIDAMRGDIEREASVTVDDVNAQLRSLAQLNQRIAGQGGSGHAPNDLLDQRDELVARINGSIKAEAHMNGDGTVSLFAATGDALVLGADASRLSFGIHRDDPDRMQLVLVSAGAEIPMRDDMLGGGKLAGLMQLRNQDLDAARYRLGQIAGALTDAYNRQQSLGTDLEGQAGGPLFETGAARALAASTNTGDAEFAITVTDGNALRASDYQLSRAGGQFELRRLADGVVSVLPSLPAEVDGLSIGLTGGAMAEGDRFTLKTASAFAGGFDVAMSSPNGWATALPAVPVPSVQNRGTVTVTDFVIESADPNVAQTVTVDFTGLGVMTIDGPGTGGPLTLPYVDGEPLRFNGWSLTLSGAPRLGDSFTVRAPSDATADNRNAQALLGLGKSGVVEGRGLSEAVGTMVAETGIRTASAASDAKQSASWLTSATAARDNVSGVNLDEEAARLLQYQQAYQAAAKVIQAAQTMFDSLLAMKG